MKGLSKLVGGTFWVVMTAEQLLAKLFGTTYNVINIIVYYMLVPLSWTVMLDIILGMPITTPILVIVWVIILWLKRKNFRTWCDWAFNKSRDFLLWFQKIGWNYVLSSVIICVIVPLLIYAALIYGLVVK